jgi:CDGSH iron-sulfur domain-containing protein 3
LLRRSKKAYCQCGLSAKLPYCDGSHSRYQTGLRPIAAEIAEPGEKAICQCHQSKDRPWCDGTHETLARKET